MGRREVHWWRWMRYFSGRTLELIGLLMVTSAMFLFFGTVQMRPMLALTSAGMFFFLIGWLLARKNPDKY